MSSVAPPTTQAVDDILADIPRGVAVRRGVEQTFEDQTMPRAAFMLPEVVAQSAKLRHDGSKVFLGLVHATREMRPTPKGLEAHMRGGVPIGIGDDRHLVTVAGSRAGKGRAVIVPTLLTYQGAVMAIDPKGELATMTARARRDKLNQRVLALDPFKTVKGHAAKMRGRFNPMSILTPDSPTLIEDAGLIADAIVVPADAQKDPHWDESARNILSLIHI